MPQRDMLRFITEFCARQLSRVPERVPIPLVTTPPTMSKRGSDILTPASGGKG